MIIKYTISGNVEINDSDSFKDTLDTLNEVMDNLRGIGAADGKMTTDCDKITL